MSIPDTNTPLLAEAARVRASGALGEAKLKRLFEYLVQSSLESRSPKEITIAIDVFDKKVDFDVSQDAVVRVYIHKLRKTLEEFYAGQRTDESLIPLRIPRGEYRLVPGLLPSVPASSGPSHLPGVGPFARRTATQAGGRGLATTLILCVAAAALAALVTFGIDRYYTGAGELERVRANPIWASVLNDDRPIVIAVGDYYLFGEADASMEVRRLIREYSVNSKEDLDGYLKRHPELADRYVDLGLRYLPTSAAFGLHDIMPIIGGGKRRINISLLSELNPATIKSTHIIYIGYVSGLGLLQQMVFSGSRFAIGNSYDELVDTKTRHSYISQTATQEFAPIHDAGKEPAYHDFGFFARLRGPGGNSILVFAGTRDEGVRQVTEVFSNAEKLRGVEQQVDIRSPFEALLEVSAVDGVNMSGKLLIVSKR